MKYEEVIKNIKKLNISDIEEIIEVYINKPTEFRVNAFDAIDLRENSHSELLKWLFDINGKNSIQDNFMKEFISYLVDMNYLNLKITINEFVQLLKTDIVVPEQNTCKIEGVPNCKYIDILFSSEAANFVCVIENKLDANINTDKYGITQLEYYKKWIENHDKYKYYEHKLFLFLSPYDLSKKLVKTVCKKDKIFITDENKKIDFTNKRFVKYLERLEYKTIEYSDIVLFIYKAIKKLNKDNSNKLFNKFLEIVTSKTDNIKIEDVKKDNKPSNFNIPLKTIMEENNEMIQYILNQYVEYWEFNNKFVSGYTPIVEIKHELVYIWDLIKY